MLGSGDIYIAPFCRPKPPREVGVGKTETRAADHVEEIPGGQGIVGYHIYRSTVRGAGFQRINPQLVTGNEFLDAPGDSPGRLSGDGGGQLGS